MTINWYHKVLLVLAAFVAMMLYFAIRSINAPIELVTDKYYEAELKYQDRINDINNASKLSAKPIVSIVRGVLLVQFPPETNHIKGTVNLYYAANLLFDKSVPLTLNPSKQFELDVSKRHGAYRIQLAWEQEGQHYFSEEKIFL